ncbi:MAG: hypothetical protein N2C14_33405, partial [Planctomycetales bacterium]
RHFMLTEKMPMPPEDSDAPPSSWAASYARHLLIEHQASRVILYSRRHYLPRMNEIQQGLDPFEESYYHERKYGEFTAEELVRPGRGEKS